MNLTPPRYFVKRNLYPKHNGAGWTNYIVFDQHEQAVASEHVTKTAAEEKQRELQAREDRAA